MRKFTQNPEKEIGILEANYNNKQQKDKLDALRKSKEAIERQQKYLLLKMH